MPRVNNGQVYTNISELPEIEEIQNGHKIIIETENGTALIDFENFLLPPENVTFKPAIDNNTRGVASLSAQQIVTNNSINTIHNSLGRQVTLHYRVAATSAGSTFSTEGVLLPFTAIQSNTIDGSFSSSTTLVSLSGSRITLNAGSYYVQCHATASGAIMTDLYDFTNATILLNSDYSSTPRIDGVIALQTRTTLGVRGFASTTRTLGVASSFTGKTQTPLTMTFQVLSGAAVPVA